MVGETGFAGGCFGGDRTIGGIFGTIVFACKLLIYKCFFFQVGIYCSIVLGGYERARNYPPPEGCWGCTCRGPQANSKNGKSRFFKNASYNRTMQNIPLKSTTQVVPKKHNVPCFFRTLQFTVKKDCKVLMSSRVEITVILLFRPGQCIVSEYSFSLPIANF